jgi:hypothetical protein
VMASYLLLNATDLLLLNAAGDMLILTPTAQLTNGVCMSHVGAVFSQQHSGAGIDQEHTGGTFKQAHIGIGFVQDHAGATFGQEHTGQKDHC